MENVKVFSAPACPECKKAKRFLDENGVEFEEVDLSQDRVSAMIVTQRTGQRRVPVIQVGEAFLVGFREGELKRALRLS